MKAPVYVPLFSVVACAFATVYCSVGVCQFIPATPDFAHERAMRDVEAWAIGTLISIALLIWSAAVLWKRSRPVAAVLVGVLFLGGFCVYRFYYVLPVIEWAAWLRSERGSIKCGLVTNSFDRSGATAAQAAIACAQSALEQHRPFLLIFTGHGIDERMSSALVGDSKGNAIELFYATGMVAPRNMLVKQRCEMPTRLEKEESSGYGFPQLHCAPWPPKTLTRDFLFW
jgi:hypothetical protein